MRISLIFLILSTIIISCFLAEGISAASINIALDEIYFPDVLNDGYSEQKVNITTDSIDPLQLSFSLTEPLKEWFCFEPESAYIDKNSPLELKISVRPTGSKIGIYQGYLIINTLSSGNEITSAISTAVDVKVSVSITDEKIIQANVDDIIVDDIEYGSPLEVSVTVQNQGNIGLDSFFTFDLLDANKDNILESAQSGNTPLLPYSTDVIGSTISRDLPLGKYYLDMKVYADDLLLRKHMLSFNVVEKGSLPVKEKKDVIVSYPEPVPLSASWFILLVWAFILIFVIWTIAKNKKDIKKIKKN